MLPGTDIAAVSCARDVGEIQWWRERCVVSDPVRVSVSSRRTNVHGQVYGCRVVHSKVELMSK
jgi:hypothetical protein